MTKKQLLNELTAQGVLKDKRLAKALAKVDRADFVPPQLRDSAYENFPLPIGFGQTISQPYTVAFMLGLLDVRAGDKILEIGAGSGWQTALLCSLAGKTGKIFAVERVAELKSLAEKNVAKYPGLHRNITIALGDGTKGFAAAAPFDKIIAAAAAQEIPQAWKEQLKIGGRIVAPVKDNVVVLDKIGKDNFRTAEHWGFAFVPLVED